ncbi:hypothetical protein YC2023_088249 [Brassica napus]
MGQCYKFVFSEIGLVKSAGSCFFTKDDIIGFSQIETTNLILRVDRQSKSYEKASNKADLCGGICNIGLCEKILHGCSLPLWMGESENLE